jgi:hypothetical protein
MKPGAIVSEGFEPVAGQHDEILERTGPVHLKKFPESDAGNRRKTLVLFLAEKLLGVAVSEGLDHERRALRRRSVRDFMNFRLFKVLTRPGQENLNGR